MSGPEAAATATKVKFSVQDDAPAEPDGTAVMEPTREGISGGSPSPAFAPAANRAERDAL